MRETRPILIVEDSDEDFGAMMRAWRKVGIQTSVVRCAAGEQALDCLLRRGKYAGLRDSNVPAMVILDLNLPRTDGRSVLAEIKRHNHLKRLPVIALTTSSNPNDVAACYRDGANSYILKPVNLARLREILQKTVAYWMDVVHLPQPGEIHG